MFELKLKREALRYIATEHSYWIKIPLLAFWDNSLINPYTNNKFRLQQFLLSLFVTNLLYLICILRPKFIKKLLNEQMLV